MKLVFFKCKTKLIFLPIHCHEGIGMLSSSLQTKKTSYKITFYYFWRRWPLTFARGMALSIAATFFIIFFLRPHILLIQLMPRCHPWDCSSGSFSGYTFKFSSPILLYQTRIWPVETNWDTVNCYRKCVLSVFIDFRRVQRKYPPVDLR